MSEEGYGEQRIIRNIEQCEERLKIVQCQVKVKGPRPTRTYLPHDYLNICGP